MPLAGSLLKLIYCLVILSLFSSLSPPRAIGKNVILLIGDGMGPQQLGLLFTYAKFAPNSIYKDRPTGIEKLMHDGQTILSLTSPADKIVVDSACSATQLATGFISGSEMIGVNNEGNRVQTVLELAEKLGKSSGLVSDTRLTHATPAAFAAHQPHRSMENDIALQMLDSGADVMLSGGLRHFLPQNAANDTKIKKELHKMTGTSLPLDSKRTDERNLLLDAQERGYSLAFTREQMSKVQSGQLLGLFAPSGMMDGIRHTQVKNGNLSSSEPSLKEMTLKAIELLSKNPQGFFLMVEGGQIDWAGHNNDTGTMLHEMLKFDETVEAVYQWAAGRKDTAVVLTADHETGSFGFSYSRFEIPKGREHAGEAFKDCLFQPYFNFIDRSVLDTIYAQKQSYYDILNNYNSSDKKGPEILVDLITRATGFPISEKEAGRVLASEKNEHYDPDHKHLKYEQFPLVHDFKEFYVYGEQIRANLIGRIMAKYQGTVWGTGTHTATPVTVTMYGTDLKLQGITTHPDVGELLKKLVASGLPH